MKSTREATRLELRVLGELEVRRDGRAQALPASKKTRALLGYLVATGRPHLREHLCALLWDGPDDPRAALRWSLTKLRPLLDDDDGRRLCADRERAGFETRGAAVDLASLQSLTTAMAREGAPPTLATLTEAAALLRGPLLEGLELPGCLRYHAWWRAQREAVRGFEVRLRRTLVERLVGLPDEALGHARALLALDPLAEASHLLVMKLLADVGRPREALAQYEECRRVLESELRVAPSGEVERLRIALTAGPRPPPPEVARPPEPARETAGTVALVGRAVECAAIDAELLAAARGQARVLLFAGDPGAGKTRLLEELRLRAAAAGGVALHGRAFEAELVRPYSAWIDALRAADLSVVAIAAGAGLAPLLPELGLNRRGPAAAAGAGNDREHLFDAVTRLLAELAQRRAPLVVTLDDLQWLDEASAALLHHATRATGAAPVLFALGVRPGEVEDNPAALRLLRSLEHDRRVRHVPVPPLDRAAVAELVAAACPDIDARQIYDESEGNPLYALEAVRAAAEAAGGRLPASLERLIAERLERLDEGARRLLPWAAALGRSFDVELLAQVSGLPVPDLLGSLEQLERRRVVRGGEGARYDFAHDLIRRAAYHALSEPRRRLVHRRIADVMAALADPEQALAGEVARHAHLGGDDEAAARACLRAATRCLRLFAHAEGADVALRGLAYARAMPAGSRLPLAVDLARTLTLNPIFRSRRRAELRRLLEEIVVDATGAGLEGEAVVGQQLLSMVEFEGGDLNAAYQRIIEAMAARAPREPASAASHIGWAARCLALLDRDLDRVELLVTRADKLLPGARDNLPELLLARGILHYQRGEHEEARARFERCRVVSVERGLRWEECDVLVRILRMDLEAGRFEQALARGTQAAPLIEKMGEGSSERETVDALLCVGRQALGSPGAGAALEAALERLRACDAKGLLALALTLAAEIDERAATPQRRALARRRGEEALAAAEAVHRTNDVAIARALLARLAAHDGDREAACVWLAPLRPLLARPHALSVRAALLVTEAHQLLGDAIADDSPRKDSPSCPT